MAKQNQPSEIERRDLPITDLEIRESDAGPRLRGHASVFNQEADIGGMFREKFLPGAFAKTIKENDIRALWNHDPNIVLGRNKAGTLSLSEDGAGLAVEIAPPAGEWGRFAVEAIRRGDVSQMSIGFKPVKAHWDRSDDPAVLPLRVIREAKLYDVSPVTYAAYEGTDISARAAEAPPVLDVIEQAGRLVRCAERGMALLDSDRGLIRDAVQQLSGCLGMTQLEPEPRHHSPTDEPELDGHHSADDTEPGLRAHSAEATPVTVALVTGSRDAIKQRLAALENRISGGAV